MTEIEKVKKPKKPKAPLKKYTIFYNIGADPQFFISNGDEYETDMIDIKSKVTGEIHSYPILIIKNITDGSSDKIPMSTIGNIRTNF